MEKDKIAILGPGANYSSYLYKILQNHECVGIFISTIEEEPRRHEVIMAIKKHFHFGAISFHDALPVIVMKNDDYKIIEHVIAEAGFDRVEPVEFVSLENMIKDKENNPLLFQEAELSSFFDLEENTKNYSRNSMYISRLNKTYLKRKIHRKIFQRKQFEREE